MGYEHYWARPEILAPKTFALWSADVRRVIDALPNGVIRDDAGINEPKITGELVCFNGNRERYYVRDDRLWWHETDVPDEKTKITVNPTSGAGMPFAVPQVLDKSFRRGGGVLRDERGWFHASCKTNGKPYDIAVIAALILMKHYFSSGCEVGSDGTISDWKHGLELAMRTTGLKVCVPATIKDR